MDFGEEGQGSEELRRQWLAVLWTSEHAKAGESVQGVAIQQRVQENVSLSVYLHIRVHRIQISQ